MRLNHPELVYKYRTHLDSPVIMWFGLVEPFRTHVKKLYTHCSLCDEVVQEGSRRFDAVEPRRTNVKVP